MIVGYSAVVDPERCGYGISAYVHIKISQHSVEVRAPARARRSRRSGTPHSVSGENDLVLLVRTRDAATMRDLVLNRLQTMPDVLSTQTVLILDEPRVTGAADEFEIGVPDDRRRRAPGRADRGLGAGRRIPLVDAGSGAPARPVGHGRPISVTVRYESWRKGRSATVRRCWIWSAAARPRALCDQWTLNGARQPADSQDSPSVETLFVQLRPAQCQR